MIAAVTRAKEAQQALDSLEADHTTPVVDSHRSRSSYKSRPDDIKAADIAMSQLVAALADVKCIHAKIQHETKAGATKDEIAKLHKELASASQQAKTAQQVLNKALKSNPQAKETEAALSQLAVALEDVKAAHDKLRKAKADGADAAALQELQRSVASAAAKAAEAQKAVDVLNTDLQAEVAEATVAQLAAALQDVKAAHDKL